MAAKAIAKDPAKFFIRKDVQDLLFKVTGFNLNTIFKPDFNPRLKNSEIQLLTQSQLESEQEKAMNKAKKLLQMPPFLNPRKRLDTVLSKDDRLNPLNLTNTKYMFIDISMNIPEHKRMIVVREANGTLRKADYPEREKVLQVYYPKEGKTNYVPSMFQPDNLEKCLELKKYLLLLKTACNKFEPNDSEFIRITHRTYEYINETKDFDHLISTRFYGPMVFYLAWYKKLDNLISHLINKSNIDDCVDIIKLYLIVHGQESKTSKLIKENTSIDELIQIFIKNDLKNGATADLAFMNYMKSNAKESTQARN